MISHFALALLLPAAWLTWRWSRLVSGALWLTLAVWLAYEAIKWQLPDMWVVGHLEWMRGVSMGTGLVGVVVIIRRDFQRSMPSPSRVGRRVLEIMMPYVMAGTDTKARADTAFEVAMAEEVARLRQTYGHGRPDYLAALLVASMGVDLAALLIHRGADQWGPQPFFQVGVLLAMCAVSVWPRRK